MLKQTLGVDAELVVGGSGIYEVAVDGNVVAKRSFFGFPSEDDVVKAVSQAIGASKAQ